jgi:hypothetical protein
MSETEQESREDRYDDVDTSHLDGVEDGCGCTEIWEHTSERAAETGDGADEPSDADEPDEPTSG